MNVSAEALEFFAERYSLDTSAMSSVLSTALARGGDFAELYFEHRVQNALVWEDQQVKSASHSAIGGVGIRVVSGESIGFAYSESLEREAMRRAADTAARVGRSGSGLPAIDSTPAALTGSSYGAAAPLAQEPPEEKVALLKRADSAARGFDPSVARVDASIGDELKYVAIARSDGTVVGDVQPLIRFNVQVLSLRDGERQVARTGGGGRLGIEYFSEHPPEDHAREAARQAILQQDALEAPAGSMPVILAAGDSGILLHEAIDMASRRTSTAKAPATTRAGSENPSQVPSSACWTMEQLPAPAGQSMLTMRGIRRSRTCSSRRASCAPTCTTR